MTDVIPAELRELRQWVCWRFEDREGKRTKVPYQPQAPALRASTTDPATWSDHATAAAASHVDGIGFVFAEGDGLAGVDLDKCVDESGQLDAKAAAIVGQLDSYTERSPSGTGVHVLLRARLNGHRRRSGNFETYDKGRFFCVTGDHVEGSPLSVNERQAQLEAVHAEMFPPRAPHTAPTRTNTASDRELLELAERSKNGADFAALYRGAWQGRYASQSEADLALCNALAFWTGGDPARMDSLFRASGLMREKWDAPRGDSTYGADTIARALEGRTEFYEPRERDEKVHPTYGPIGPNVRPASKGGPVGPPFRPAAKVSEPEPEPAAGLIDGAQSVAFAAIDRERIRWLWDGRIPLGMLTLLIGDPGLGKSLLTCMLAAQVSKAGGTALMLTAEDSPSATVRPRLEAVEADLTRVRLVEVRREGVAEGLALPDDVDQLDALVARDGAALVVVDPLSAHLTEAVNSWRDQSVRRALAPLARMAAERRCAVVVVAHLNKAKGADALHRTGGSIGIPAAARSALLLARDPEDPEADLGSCRVLAHVKTNVSAPAKSLSLAVEPIMLPGDELIGTARLVIKGESHVTGADLLDAPRGEERTERDEAADFLRDLLSDSEPKAAKEVKAAATEAGIHGRTLERAKTVLGVEVRRESEGTSGAGKWTWRLPPQDRQPQDRHAYISPGGGLAEIALPEPNIDPRKTATDCKTAKTAIPPARSGEPPLTLDEIGVIYETEPERAEQLKRELLAEARSVEP